MNTCEGVKLADTFFVCCSQNAENMGFVNKNFLSQLKPGVLIVNVARVSQFKHLFFSYFIVCICRLFFHQRLVKFGSWNTSIVRHWKCTIYIYFHSFYCSCTGWHGKLRRCLRRSSFRHCRRSRHRCLFPRAFSFRCTHIIPSERGRHSAHCWCDGSELSEHGRESSGKCRTDYVRRSAGRCSE